MADEMKKVGVQFVSEGAEQSTKNIESFDQANQGLVSTLDKLVQRQADVGAALSTVETQIKSISDTMSEMLSRDLEEGFDDTLFDELQKQHDELIEKADSLAERWTNLSAKIGVAKGEIEGFKRTAEEISAPATGGNAATETIVTETNKAKESVSQLTESMRLVAQVAKEYGISGARASQEVAMGAKEAGVSIEQFARMVLADTEEAKQGVLGIGTAFQQLPRDINRAITEANSELLKLVQAQQEAARGGQGGAANETLLGQMMGEMDDTQWQQFNDAVDHLYGIWTKAASGAKEYGEAVSTAGEASEVVAGQVEAASQASTNLNQTQKTGIEIQDEYFASLNQGSQVVKEVTQNISVLDQTTSDFGNKWRAAFQSFRDIGKSPKEALDGLNKAVEEGVGAGVVLNRNLDERFRLEQELAKSGKSWNEIQKEMNDLAEKNATAMSRVGAAGIQSSRAFFALTLASFGVMSVAQELKKSFGDELPPAFEKASSAIQQIASFGSAGAFVGGVPGAIFGGIAGGLVALTTAAVSLSPELQQLNKQLDNMSNRDEVVKTLADIADVSTDIAEVWLEAARKDSAFAAQLEEIVKKGEPVPGMLASIKEASAGLGGALDGLGDSFEELGERINQTLLLGFASLNWLGKYFEGLTQGKSIAEAGAEANERLWEVLENVTRATQGLGVSESDAAALTDQANRILEDQEKILERLAAAAEKYADALSSATYREGQALERMNSQLAQAQQQFNNAVSDAAEQRANAVLQADRRLADQSEDLWQNYQNTVTDANQNMADRVFDIHTNLANKIADIQMQLGNRIFDIQSNLADRMADIQAQLGESIFQINQDLENKLADLAHQRNQQIQQSNQKQIDAAKDLSRKLYEIERERLQSIEALAFSTHEQLQDARTSHDRDRILRRAQFEQAQIDQRANNARQDAYKDYADKLEQAKLEAQLAQDNYNYQVELAKRLADQKIEQAQRAAAMQAAQAQRDAAQQIAIAQRQAEQQLAIAQREAAQQTAIAERENAQQLANAQRRYQQEIEDARRAHAQALADAQRAEAQRVADAQRAQEQRVAAIHEAYEAERREILHTLELALMAYHKIIESINLAKGTLFDFAQQYQNFIDDPLGLDPNNPSNDKIPLPPLPDTTPVNFFPNPITPLSETSRTSNNSINIVINDATDPVRVGQQVRRVLQDTLSGAG